MTDSREYPAQPMVGVGVVVFKGEAVWLVEGGKPPNKGALSLPGGAQNLGETVRQTAAREVLEETGVEIEVTDLVDVVDAVRADTAGRVRYHYTLIDFAAEWRAGEATAGSDAAKVLWVALKDIGTLGLWSETERIIRKAAELRQAA